MAIKWGNLTIEKIFSGVNRINKVLFGSNIVFEGITVTPSTDVLASTTSSVNFRLTQNDPIAANIAWAIRSGSNVGTIVASGTTSIINQNATIDVSATGLSAGVNYFLTGVIATAVGKGPSAAGTERTANLVTITPTTAVLSSTTSSVTFRLTQTDSVASTITWQIRSTSNSGTILNSGTTASTAQNGTVDVSATGLSSGVSYFLTGVRSTATNKTQSALATERSTTLITATPGVAGVSSTSTSVTFRLTQNDIVSTGMSYEIATASAGGSILVNTTTASTAQGGTRDVSATSLNSSTTYWLRNVRATAAGKSQSAIPAAISRTTSATPPPPPPPPPPPTPPPPPPTPPPPPPTPPPPPPTPPPPPPTPPPPPPTPPPPPPTPPPPPPTPPPPSCPASGTHIPQPDGCICIADGNCGFTGCFCPD